MARIILEPRFYEVGPFREQYERLEKDLEAAGHSVAFKYEDDYRSAGEVARTAWDLAVHILDAADEELIAALVGYLIARLKGKAGINRNRRRRAFIYGSRGERLREVELPDEESAP